MLPEEERTDRHITTLTAIVDDVLTVELQEDILNAIERLRMRLIEVGDRQQAARAGLVLDFMEQQEADAMWSTIGLVLALAQRSLAAGFALTGAVAATGGNAASGGWESTPEFQAVLEEYPGLVEYMVVRQDRAWTDGVQSLFWGDLWLDLFAVDELEPQLETWGCAIEQAEAENKQVTDACFEEIKRYAAGLLTPERIGRARARLDVVLESGLLEPDEEEFVHMVADVLADEETVEARMDVLTAAFVGELGLLFDDREDEQEWEEDE